ncbi:MAG: hypothetical protein QXK94_03710 [Candidatus Jordarchaeales archaeon]
MTAAMYRFAVNMPRNLFHSHHGYTRRRATREGHNALQSCVSTPIPPFTTPAIRGSIKPEGLSNHLTGQIAALTSDRWLSTGRKE